MSKKSKLYDLSELSIHVQTALPLIYIHFYIYFQQIHTWDTSHDKCYVVTPQILRKNIEVCAFNTLNVIFTHMVHVLGRNM
jgi:hypothetical protein